MKLLPAAESVRGYVLPFWFSTECKAGICAIVGILLAFMSYKAGVRISRTTVGGIASCIGATMYLIRQFRKMGEGTQLDMRNYVGYLREKTFVVTGGSRGIGLEVVTLLLELGAKDIVVAMRDAEKRAGTVVASIEKRLLENRHPMDIKGLRFVDLQLDKKESVRQCGERLKEMCPKVDVLVCNAGVIKGNVMATNWGGHVLLIESLKSLTKRVVLVSSCAHMAGSIHKTIDACETKSWFGAYGTSKLAMLFEAQYLSQTYGMEAVSVHPGAVRTDMVASQSTLSCMAICFKSARSGGMTVAYCAVEPTVVPGAYYDTMRVAPKYPPALDPEQYERYRSLRANFLSS